MTRNGGDFPIDEVIATVVLPSGARIIAADEYTGVFGAKKKILPIPRILSAGHFFKPRGG